MLESEADGARACAEREVAFAEPPEEIKAGVLARNTELEQETEEARTDATSARAERDQAVEREDAAHAEAATAERERERAATAAHAAIERADAEVRAATVRMEAAEHLAQRLTKDLAVARAAQRQGEDQLTQARTQIGVLDSTLEERTRQRDSAASALEAANRQITELQQVRPRQPPSYSRSPRQPRRPNNGTLRSIAPPQRGSRPPNGAGGTLGRTPREPGSGCRPSRLQMERIRKECDAEREEANRQRERAARAEQNAVSGEAEAGSAVGALAD